MTAPLEQLHDILPGPQVDELNNQSIVLISASIPILFCFVVLYKIWPRYKFYWLVKREFRLIIQEHPDNYIPAINLLLKKTANRFWPLEQFASLHTLDWLKFLDENSSCQFSRFANEWEKWSYSDTTPSIEEKKAIIHECKLWFRAVRSKVPL